MTNDLYREVTNQIVAALEKGVAPWVKPWSLEPDPIPMNVVSERPYRGINVLLLNLKALFAGYSRNRWLTYRQAGMLGGQVRGGEHGVRIVFYELRKSAAQVDAKDEAEERLIPFLRSYTVFNVAQVDGLAPSPQPVLAWDAWKPADDLVAASGAVIRHGGSAAYYVPNEDRIQIPPKEYFATATDYYSTLLHELTHWTGYSTRCNRDFSRRSSEDAYAAEELVAEIGSAFLCAHCRIDGRLQHASYIDHWLNVLRKDKRAIFVAATQAQRAADFLASRVAEDEREAA
jgi:antirestriction protein ArdC